MEFTSMSDKILRTIENIIKNDPQIEDFTIIPTDDNSMNRSPVLYENHHLGLESWCIKYVYEYVCAQLLPSRQRQKRISFTQRDSLKYLINGGLFINPDVTTFWNMRRQLVEIDALQYENELLFSKLVLTRKPKSNEAFAYRRWLLTRILEKYKPHLTPPYTLLESELTVCTLTATQASNNYHSWTHRKWCLLNLVHYYSEIIPIELEFSEQWINEHVSENSGYHYRQILIDYIKNSGSKVPKQYFLKVVEKLNISIETEFDQLIVFLLGPVSNKSPNDSTEYVNCIILLLYELLVVISHIDQDFIEHESLWLHRRYIIYKLLETSHSYLADKVSWCKNSELEALSDSHSNILNCIYNETYQAKQPKIFKCQPTRFEGTNLCSILRDVEGKFVARSSLRSSLQSEYAKRHEKWLKYVVSFDISEYRTRD